PAFRFVRSKLASFSALAVLLPPIVNDPALAVLDCASPWPKPPPAAVPPAVPPPLLDAETPTAPLGELDYLDAASRAALKFTDPALWIDPAPSAEMFVPSKLASPLVVLMLRLPPDEKPPTTAWLEDDCSSSWP